MDNSLSLNRIYITDLIHVLDDIIVELTDDFPFWINMFHLRIGHPGCLLSEYDMMSHPLYPHSVKYDYSVFMCDQLFIKHEPIEDHSWKRCVLRNREYEAFIQYPILDDIKNIIFSFL